MRKNILACCTLLITAATLLTNNRAYAQKSIPADLYKASTIPDSLKKDAHSVVRYKMTDVTIKAPGKAVIKKHKVITILDEKAEREAAIALFYNKFNSVNGAEMIVYNADGVVIKKYHRGDMYDRSLLEGSIVTDDRMMVVGHTIATYPVTVDISTEETRNSFMDLPDWNIRDDEQSVQNTSFHIKVNPSVGFRYMNRNTSVSPQKTTEDGLDSYLWEVKNLKAVKPEDESLDWAVLPRVVFATNNFEYGGLPGNINTWDNFGKWIQGLNSDVCTLPPSRVEEIKQMTASIKTDKEKARFLYEYLQKNMRYVSVQLGIGGLKPFPAAFVDQKKYGDCKALSNYMVALLKAVNIPAYYAIVRAEANEEPADPSFPNNHFNHVITCIPFKNDTTWLECTSTTQPFGKLGTFTENRNALLITENGGKLVNTPKSTINDNEFNSEVHLVLQTDGGAKVKMQMRGSGGYRDIFLGLDHIKVDEQKESMIRGLGFKQPSIIDIKPADDKDGIKQVDVEMEYDKFCDIMAGDKQFYRPRVFDLWRVTVPVLDKRVSDYYFEHPMKKTCVTTIDLPPGFEVESLPANSNLTFSYGNYEVKYVYDAAKNQVINTTKFNLNNFVIPAAKYNEMQQYMDNIAKVQNKKLVLRKKA